jgi:hypothetical protein
MCRVEADASASHACRGVGGQVGAVDDWQASRSERMVVRPEGFSDISVGSQPVAGRGLVVAPSIRGRYTAWPSRVTMAAMCRARR